MFSLLQNNIITIDKQIEELTAKIRNQQQIKTHYETKVDTYEDVGCSQRGKEGNDIYGYSIKYDFQIYNGYKFNL